MIAPCCQGDGVDGAVDRFYGARGTQEAENPMYVYGKSATEMVQEVAPQSADERGRVIESMHLSKFAELDADGHEILDPMMRSWGVDTVVVVGSWTEDCVLATAFDAADRHGYDVVIISDAVSTGTPVHASALEVMGSAVAKVVNSSQFLTYFAQASSTGRLRPPSNYGSVATAAALRTEPSGSPAGHPLRGPSYSSATNATVPLPLTLALVGVASVVSAFAAFRVAGAQMASIVQGKAGEPVQHML